VNVRGDVGNDADLHCLERSLKTDPVTPVSQPVLSKCELIKCRHNSHLCTCRRCCGGAHLATRPRTFCRVHSSQSSCSPSCTPPRQWCRSSSHAATLMRLLSLHAVGSRRLWLQRSSWLSIGQTSFGGALAHCVSQPDSMKRQSVVPSGTGISATIDCMICLCSSTCFCGHLPCVRHRQWWYVSQGSATSPGTPHLFCQGEQGTGNRGSSTGSTWFSMPFHCRTACH
jgi:hypothetical protein